MARRSEERDTEARRSWSRSGRVSAPAVTVGAVVSALLAIVFTVSAVIAGAGVEVGGETRTAPIAVFAVSSG